MKKASRLIVAVGLLLTNSALACPEYLADLDSSYLPDETDTLCELSDRYKAATQEWEKANPGSQATQIPDAIAPRFINMPDWKKSRQKVGFDPAKVYAPVPQVWKLWETGANEVGRRASQNFSSQSFVPVTEDWLQSLHVMSITGKKTSENEIRPKGLTELGVIFKKDDAIAMERLGVFQNFPFSCSTDPTKPLVQWKSTQCLEDSKLPHPHQEAKILAASDIPPESSEGFIGPDGKRVTCGFLIYAPQEEIKPQLQKLLDETNNAAASWMSGKEAGDPILQSAKAQQWFIAIHPYGKGNGRLSRYLMEYLLMSLGLPPPLLSDMDGDVYSTPEEWAKEVGRGMLREVEVIEACVKDPSKEGCLKK